MTVKTDPMTVATTAMIHGINHKALTRNFNRALDPKFVDTLDPDGFHLLTFSMVHGHKHGVKVADHMRTMWALKVKDSDTPVRAFLDMSMSDFSMLPRIVKDDDDNWSLVN